MGLVCLVVWLLCAGVFVVSVCWWVCYVILGDSCVWLFFIGSYDCMLFGVYCFGFGLVHCGVWVVCACYCCVWLMCIYWCLKVLQCLGCWLIVVVRRLVLRFEFGFLLGCVFVCGFCCCLGLGWVFGLGGEVGCLIGVLFVVEFICRRLCGLVGFAFWFGCCFCLWLV